jgi:hypothetical protein
MIDRGIGASTMDGDVATEANRAAEELDRRSEYSALRTDISVAMARSDRAHVMLHACAQALVDHLDVAFARIWTLRRGGDVLELQASAGAYTRLDGRYSHVAIGDLKIGRIALERVPYRRTLELLGCANGQRPSAPRLRFAACRVAE